VLDVTIAEMAASGRDVGAAENLPPEVLPTVAPEAREPAGHTVAH